MVIRAPKVGGEIVGYCTKCRLMLNHRIAAMVGTKPVRVICLTCGSEHNHRARMPGETAAKAAGRTPGAPRESKATVAERREREREVEWGKAIAGKAVSDFKKYSINGVFEMGDLLRHSKFGDGVVTGILDANKIEVLFKEDIKTLAQGIGR